MYKDNVVSALLLMALSVWLIFWGIPQSTFGVSSIGLSPRGLPTVMAAGVGLFSLIQLIAGLAGMARGLPSSEPGDLGFTPSHWKILGLLAALAGVSLLVMLLAGFIAAGIVFLIAMQYLAGSRKYVPMILVAVITPIVLDRAIWYAMGILLPQGVLFN